MRLLWSMLLILLFSVVVYFPVTDADIFWHLASAREMIKEKAFLYSDPFSISAKASQWINLHWMFQLVVYGVNKIGGLYALVFLKCMVFGAAFVLSLHKLVKPNLAARVLFSITVVYGIRFYILERPVMFTVMFMIVLLYLLNRYEEKEELKYLLPIPFIQIIWTNMQGLSPIGLFLVLSFLPAALAKKNRKMTADLLMVVALQFAAQFINPYGYKGVTWPIRLLQRILPGFDSYYSFGIEENVPLHMVFTENSSLVLLVFITYVVYMVAKVARKENLFRSDTIVLTSFFALSLIASRNVVLYAFALMYFSNRILCSTVEIVSMQNGRINFALKLITIALVFLPVVNSVMLWPGYKDLKALSPFRFCEGAADFLTANKIHGELFNTDRSGGYLLYTGVKSRVYMDGRFMLRSSNDFGEYIRALQSRRDFETLCAKHGFTHALFPLSPSGNNHNILYELLGHPSWKTAYVDGGSILLVNKELPGIFPCLDLRDNNGKKGLLQREVDKWAGNEVVKAQSLKSLGHIFTFVK